MTREAIAGWARDDTEPGHPIRLRITDNGAPLGEVVADEYRKDLHDAAIGAGCHAFSLTVPGGFSPDRRHLIEVARVDDGRALHGSPFVLEAVVSPALVLCNARTAAWRGRLDVVTRERIDGWAWDDRSPDIPLALVILNNGEVIARVLANRFREDLVDAGIGTGGHAFSLIIPGGLSPLTRHVIQVVGEADGCDIPGSPVTLEPGHSFDAALEHAVSRAVGALATAEDRARVLAFLAAQSERLLQDNADAASGRESRLIRRQFERRWGRLASADSRLPSPRRRALVIDDLAPVAERDAGSSAILSHMRGLQLIGYDVSFIAAAELSPPAAVLAALEARDIECCHAPYYASVEEVLRRQPGGFEVVYLHRVGNAAKYLALVRDCMPRARTVYSVADLHHVRVARQAKIEQRQELLPLSRRLRIDECMAAATANVVITHSAFEAAWLLQAVKDCNVHVVPWEVPLRPTTRPWGERQGIAFVGGFRHAPNLDAVRFLAAEIMPRVRRADVSIECTVIGADMPAAIQRLAAPGIVPSGYVADLRAVHDRVRLMVAPLRYGAGAKGKVLESFAAGLPCVMTSIAAEGLRLPASLRASIADEAAQLAERIVQLHADEAAASALAQAGSAYVAAQWNERAVVAALQAAIEGPRRAAAPMAPTAAGQTPA